jgi:hypothetical protein
VFSRLRFRGKRLLFAAVMRNDIVPLRGAIDEARHARIGR